MAGLVSVEPENSSSLKKNSLDYWYISRANWKNSLHFPTRVFSGSSLSPCFPPLVGECDLSQKLVPEEEQQGPLCWWNPQVSVVWCNFELCEWGEWHDVRLLFIFLVSSKRFLWGSMLTAGLFLPGKTTYHGTVTSSCTGFPILW